MKANGWVNWSGLATLLEELAAGLSAFAERLPVVVGLLSDQQAIDIRMP
jgi:hypothetical protein